MFFSLKDYCYIKVNVFIPTIEIQLQEIDNRFKQYVIELLILTLALNSQDGY